MKGEKNCRVRVVGGEGGLKVKGGNKEGSLEETCRKADRKKCFGDEFLFLALPPPLPSFIARGVKTRKRGNNMCRKNAGSRIA